MFQVLFGFIPWIIYWSFSGPGLWTIAILGGLIAPGVGQLALAQAA